MSAVMEAMGDLKKAVKVGEGSYGEAFKLGR